MSWEENGRIGAHQAFDALEQGVMLLASQTILKPMVLPRVSERPLLVRDLDQLLDEK